MEKLNVITIEVMKGLFHCTSHYLQDNELRTNETYLVSSQDGQKVVEYNTKDRSVAIFEKHDNNFELHHFLGAVKPTMKCPWDKELCSNIGVEKFLIEGNLNKIYSVLRALL